LRFVVTGLSSLESTTNTTDPGFGVDEEPVAAMWYCYCCLKEVFVKGSEEGICRVEV